MKKFLLSSALLVIAFHASAQQAKKAIEPYQIRYANQDDHTSAKSTITGSRWYNHAEVMSSLTGNLMTDHLLPLWYDSSVLQNYTTGLAPIEYISAAQIVDPIHFTIWNNPDVFDPNIIAIEPQSVYKVDSISFSGAYVKNPNRSVNIVDTLILSVSATSTDIVDLYSYYSTTASHDAWASNYVNSGSQDSVLQAYTIDSLNVDAINRASNVGGRIIWKVLLTDTDRQEAIGGMVDVIDFTYPVMVNGAPGMLAVNPGYGVVVTITFKSGDTIVPNVDTFKEYHHLLLSSGEVLGDTTVMPYFRYQFLDRNMSNLMQYNNDSVYQPSVFLDGRIGASFGYEFHNIAAHIYCDDCLTVIDFCCPGHTDNLLKQSPTIYPNPANETLNISFAQQQSDDVSISITNAIGQVVERVETRKDQVNHNNKVSVDVSHLPVGIYIYTIRTGTQQSSGHFTIMR